MSTTCRPGSSPALGDAGRSKIVSTPASGRDRRFQRWSVYCPLPVAGWERKKPSRPTRIPEEFISRRIITKVHSVVILVAGSVLLSCIERQDTVSLPPGRILSRRIQALSTTNYNKRRTTDGKSHYGQRFNL
jgi:hypothetical protein